MKWLIEFLFPHRLHRLAYFIRFTVANALAYLIYSSVTADSSWRWIPDVVLGIYAVFFIILPRIRDIGMSKWWLLISVIPFVNEIFGIILLFRAAPILRNPSQPQATASGT